MLDSSELAGNNNNRGRSILVALGFDQRDDDLGAEERMRLPPNNTADDARAS
jgi:hypothetical protein